MNQQQTLDYGSSHSESGSNAAADVNAKVTSLFPYESEAAPVEQALDLFNRMSRQITDSYRTLESRVNQLSGELTAEASQRQAELEAKERMADRLTTLLDVLPAAVVVLDSQGVVSQCNPAAVELLGEPLEGQRWLDIIQRCFAPRRDDGHEVSLKDGRRVSIEIRSMENEPGQLILLSDLTETRRLQSQLSRAERLSSMGRMVASLAHQIRTPLSAAMLYAGHLCQDNLGQDMRMRCAEKLMSRLTHLEQQVRDMLIFARGETRLTERLTVRNLLDGLERSAETVMQTHQACLILPESLPEVAVHCNRDALNGALMNLVNNGLEAGATQLTVEVETAGDHLRIQLCDNGSGFDQKEVEQLLEAFHTTKSHGTGLGLAVVQAVIKAHHGQFELQSAGQGAKALIELPLADEKAYR
ncbi:ATP-binding protein [Marinobacteraceae bacterium S3BR75-40.1]